MNLIVIKSFITNWNTS